MHATPGDMKSLRSSAERSALMVANNGGGRGGEQVLNATGAVSQLARNTKLEKQVKLGGTE